LVGRKNYMKRFGFVLPLVVCVSGWCSGADPQRSGREDTTPPVERREALAVDRGDEQFAVDEKRYPPIIAVAFLPNGRELISISKKGIVVWNITSGETIRTMEKTKGGFPRAYALSGDGKRLLCERGSGLSLWDVRSGKMIWDSHASEVTPKVLQIATVAVALSHDGRLALSGGAWGPPNDRFPPSEPLLLWDMEKGKLIRALRGHKGTVWSVAFSPDGKLAISSSRDKTIKIWRLTDGAVLRTFSNEPYGSSVGFSGNGKAAFSRGLIFRKWETATGKLVETSKELEEELKGKMFTYSPDNEFCVEHLVPLLPGKTVREAGILTLREVTTGRAVRTWGPLTDRRRGITGLRASAFSANGKLVAVGGYAQFLQVLNVEDGKLMRDFPGPPEPLK
jgi:WD40 repeat protein